MSKDFDSPIEVGFCGSTPEATQGDPTRAFYDSIIPKDIADKLAVAKPQQPANPVCPKCSKPLNRVRNLYGSMLNDEQFASCRAGDWFCGCHTNWRGNTNCAYFWDSEVETKPAQDSPEGIHKTTCMATLSDEMDCCAPDCPCSKPGLTLAQIERLAILSEECGEVIQEVSKILRHGYASYHPSDAQRVTNRGRLAQEIGHIDFIISLMRKYNDFEELVVVQSSRLKASSIAPYLHHQNYSEKEGV